MNSVSMLPPPLYSLALTFGCYSVALVLKKKLNRDTFNPVIVAVLLLLVALIAFDISYDQFAEGMDLISTLLGTATVALAVPLYKQLAHIKASLFAIIVSVICAGFVASVASYLFAYYLQISESLQLAIMSKSVTVPVAICIAEKIGEDSALAVFFVFSTGIIGSLIAPSIFRLFNIEDQRAMGLSLGATCYGLGLVRAFQYSVEAGVYSIIGMSLMAIGSGIFLPSIILSYFK
ncbi:LrgB family protein [Marinomonas mediterranea]|jgi:Putative effector of murein hydrolase|uniref:LrgB family protein n=1 Tax=Marinomonas mediterranea (strain ATCC 700492 / JCM 21426 / NBRC 103028 / MMB-1) TaxID=717774 RepID=F2JVE5_MARM1|nr:LrgB family protein [Marinomonas mediterranea]ADZ89403.1 LrgB family protein [Marinomonas mediterranea MMB-1]WCN15661.1 hypothetical protein GV053_00475 [Marinomonas mediterranea MMB-1]